MKEVQLAYMGRRLNGKYLHHFYMQMEESNISGTHLIFKKQIKPAHIGQILKASFDGKTIKGIVLPCGAMRSDFVSQWSIESAHDVAQYNSLKLPATLPGGHIDALIKTVKQNTHTVSERAKVAAYIISKLI